jgi:predicted component of type VI protein secretion system
MKKIALALLIVFLAGNSFASPPLPLQAKSRGNSNDTVKERLIGSFVKTFAKTYVATNDLQKFKEKNIKKILKMDEAKFQRVYGKIYQEMIADLPENLKKEYGIEPVMTREMAIARINSFTSKKKIYQMINAIPNKMIAQHFKKHKDEFKKGMEGNHSADKMIDQLLEDPAATKS